MNYLSIFGSPVTGARGVGAPPPGSRGPIHSGPRLPSEQSCQPTDAEAGKAREPVNTVLRPEHGKRPLSYFFFLQRPFLSIFFFLKFGETQWSYYCVLCQFVWRVLTFLCAFVSDGLRIVLCVIYLNINIFD